jgi:uncharacterized protein (DUF1684 family)
MANYAEAMHDERQMKDAFFQQHPHSPLTPDQKTHFNGLDYYDVREDLNLVLEAEELPSKDGVNIQTSTGSVQTYQRWGKVHFEVDGQPVELTLFYSPQNDHFFLPFKDATNGSETYGAGRYLDPERIGEATFHIDFNRAYSPYCAYNANWSCPLTPPENVLNVRIEAGEKKPSDEWAEAY